MDVMDNEDGDAIFFITCIACTAFDYMIMISTACAVL